MKREKSRRTTLTLPSACLDTAERIARERHSNLSSVISEALQRGLREEEQRQRSEAILQSYSRAFSGLSEDELLLLDGIVLEQFVSRTPNPKKQPKKMIKRRGQR